MANTQPCHGCNPGSNPGVGVSLTYSLEYIFYFGTILINNKIKEIEWKEKKD